MRYKVVPEPVDFETLRGVHDAVPLVPERVDDCCDRIVERTAVPSRDAAREWITFLQALGLVEETPRGFKRLRTDPGREDLADAFAERVFGASELLDALEASGSLDAAAAFDHVRPVVPRWERDRHTDWESEWCERTSRLLEWARILGHVEREDSRYRYVGRE